MTRRLTLLVLWPAVLGLGAQNAQAGGLLAFTRLDGGHWQVWASEADGANPHRVTDSAWDKRSLRAMPGRKDVLLRDNEGRLYQVSLTNGLGGESRVAADFEVVKDFDFHPRAGWLIAAYAPNAMDNVCIWHIPLAGGPKRLLIPDPYLNETPRWFPEGDRFVFVKSHLGKSRLALSEPTQAQSREIATPGLAAASDPSLSPDGKQIVFCGRGESSTDLWLCSENGAGPRPLYTAPGLKAEPVWSPDGEWVYFAAWDGKNFRVARIARDGDRFSYVSPAGVDCRCPALVGDERRT
jgi:Tol biopolymer transport system component